MIRNKELHLEKEVIDESVERIRDYRTKRIRRYPE